MTICHLAANKLVLQNILARGFVSESLGVPPPSIYDHRLAIDYANIYFFRIISPRFPLYGGRICHFCANFLLSGSSRQFLLRFLLKVARLTYYFVP